MKGFPHDAKGELRLWEAATGRRLAHGLKGPTDKVRHLALSPDGTRLAAVAWDHLIQVWDLTTGGLLTLEGPLKATGSSVTFSADSKRLLSAQYLVQNALQIKIWDLAARKPVVTLESSLVPDVYGTPDLSPDGKYVAFTVDDGVVNFSDAATGRDLFHVDYGERYVTSAVFSPDGRRLAACGEIGIKIWNVATHELITTWQTGVNCGDCLAFSPNGRFLAMGSVEGVVELWDSGTGQRTRTFKGQAGAIRAIAFSPDGTRLTSSGSDGTVRIWDTTGQRDAIPILTAASGVDQNDLSPDGRTILTRSGWTTTGSKSLRFASAVTGEQLGEAIQLRNGVNSCAWSSDGMRLIVTEAGQGITIWDTGSGKALGTFRGEAAAVLPRRSAPMVDRSSIPARRARSRSAT